MATSHLESVQAAFAELVHHHPHVGTDDLGLGQKDASRQLDHLIIPIRIIVILLLFLVRLSDCMGP